jgi:membrane fusion protein, multidrug efflux system
MSEPATAPRDNPPAPPSRSPSPRRRRIGTLVLAGGAAAAVCAAGAFWWHARSRESTDDAQIEADIAIISSRVGGTVKEVVVADNQAVAAGDVLMRLDPTDFEVALRRAEAEAADARAAAVAARASVPITTTTSAGQVDTAGAAVAAAKQQVAGAQARLDEAEANLKRASSDLSRYRTLVEKDEISRQQFDAAVSAEAAAHAARDAANASLAEVRSRVVQADAQLRTAGTGSEQVAVERAKADAADAAVLKAEATVEQARLNLEYATVKAPRAGVVSKKGVQPGETVLAGQQVFAIVPVDAIWVVANFKESQLRLMRPGQPVVVHVDAYGRDYAGKVDSIGGATAGKFSLLPPENATGNFVKVVQRVPVKILLDLGQDADHLLRPGMSVVPTVRVR